MAASGKAGPAGSKTMSTDESGLQLLARMEQDVVGKCAKLGREHLLVAKAFEALALKYNGVAMRLTEEGQFQTAHALLTKAELLSQQAAPPERAASQAKLLGVTVSNFGCFYQKTGDPYRALQYLEKALAIESVPGSMGNPAGTLLNICAVLSSLGRHEKALEHAQRAIRLLTVDCAALVTNARSTPAVTTQHPSSNGQDASHGNSSSDGSKSPAYDTPSNAPAGPSEEEGAVGAAAEAADVSGRVRDDVSGERRTSQGRAGVLAVAYHSLAVQQEFLHALEDAHVSYRQAVHVADSCWGPGHGMTQTLRASLLDFAKKQRTDSSGGKQHRNGTSRKQNGAAELSRSTPPSTGPVSRSPQKSDAEKRHWESIPPSPRGLRIQRWLADEKRRGSSKASGRPRKSTRAHAPMGPRPGNYPGRWSKNPVGQRGLLVERWANHRGLATTPHSRPLNGCPATVAAVRRSVPADTGSNRRLPTSRDSEAEAAALFPVEDKASQQALGRAHMRDVEALGLESLGSSFMGDDAEGGEGDSEDENGSLEAMDGDTRPARPGTAPALESRSRESFCAKGLTVQTVNDSQEGQRALITSGASNLLRRPKTAPSGEASRNVTRVSQETVACTWGGSDERGTRRGKVRSLNALQLPKGRSKSGRDEFPSARSPSAPALQKYLGSAKPESIFDSRPKGPPVKDNDYASIIRNMATLVMNFDGS
ncbi:hypothetical protein KFL_000540190 [Klebsormidium nitens]|uniref:Uncharacterized protein n=1 Tax=Klebsormidium nitens TaxID=105231 RepID=A0A0U9HKA8_KLENI|nr:hypothetical protein KFL_000540190 [Klebsormidium nitens]|eukprot:GAQ80443.1 hypothetical protein KFL_000540190 [Klebsormidium nitens]